MRYYMRITDNCNRILMSSNVRKRTFRYERPARIQIRLRIRAVWSESSLGAFWISQDSEFLHADNTDSLVAVDAQADLSSPLRKHAYSNRLNILQPKTENFQMKKKTNTGILHISAQNIDCRYSLEPPRRGGSNEYPQSMFFRKIRKIMYTPVNPSFTILIKVGFKGVKIYRRVFVRQKLRFLTSWL